ncbi:MAG TPA: hypothetical protein VHT75_04430 [Acidimicrobiales bacterium]|jgi:hypothetical protein|nr:hypothetical protein [Acidimicrobiales bacterium]
MSAACGLSVGAEDGQSIVVALADGTAAPVALYDDAALGSPTDHAVISAYAGTQYWRPFYVATPGTYTLTVTQDGAVIATLPVTLAAGVTVTVGPWETPLFGKSPAPQVLDGGTP